MASPRAALDPLESILNRDGSTRPRGAASDDFRFLPLAFPILFPFISRAHGQPDFAADKRRFIAGP